LPLACAAGTNAEPFRYGGVEFTTNWFGTNSHWRASGGIIYNRSFSEDWKSRPGVCLAVTNGVALIEHRSMEPIYHTIPGYSWGSRRTGNFLGGGYVEPRKEQIGETQQVERWLMTNAPPELKPGWKADGFECLHLGSALWLGESLELRDYGRTPTEAEIAALRLKFEAIATRAREAKEKKK